MAASTWCRTPWAIRSSILLETSCCTISARATASFRWVRKIRPNKLRTAPLWGLRTKSRFMHDLASLTLEDAIRRHRGEARHVTARFRALTAARTAAVDRVSEIAVEFGHPVRGRLSVACSITNSAANAAAPVDDDGQWPRIGPTPPVQRRYWVNRRSSAANRCALTVNQALGIGCHWPPRTPMASPAHRRLSPGADIYRRYDGGTRLSATDRRPRWGVPPVGGRRILRAGPGGP